MKVAIYARVSTSDQDWAMQISQLEDYCRRRNLTIFDTYTDTISSKRTKRPGLDLMMSLAKQRRFDAVLVWKYDRFARSVLELTTALGTLESLGINFISITEGIDTSTPIGRFFFNIAASFAEFERSLIGQRVRAGMAYARQHGTKSGKSIGRQVVDLDSAEVLRLRATGLSWTAISKATGKKRSLCQLRYKQAIQQGSLEAGQDVPLFSSAAAQPK